MNDEKLIGWLCFMRHQWSNGIERGVLPTCVHTEFVKRGWLEIGDDVDWEGDRRGHITDAGLALCDLYGPDWGINTIPEESEA